MIILLEMYKKGQVLYSPLGEQAFFVSLVGLAGHPNPNGVITIAVPAKEIHTEKLLVRNITESPETYKVSTVIEKVHPEKFDGYYDIQHADTVKVWGEASATCNWTYVCYEECEMHLRVMFVNDKTREYQFYNIVATITASESVATLVFESRARETVQKEVVIANSLHEKAEYLIHCTCLTCPESVTVGPSSEKVVPMTYSPLVVGQTEDSLEVYNQQAGSYIYKVVLKCLPAKIKELNVETPLGTMVPVRLRVQNNTHVSTEFITTISHPSIQAEPHYSLGPNEKGKFLVWFEPTEPGLQITEMSFNSSIAGEFVFSIKGKGLVPKPQGPLNIKAGSSISIKFKNVFEDTRTFRIVLDRPEFYVKNAFETIKSKKDVKITVYLIEMPQTAAMPAGSLTIECYDPLVNMAHWTYFLQGVP